LVARKDAAELPACLFHRSPRPRPRERLDALQRRVIEPLFGAKRALRDKQFCGVKEMNQAEPQSPRISRFSWGHIEVDGHPPFKDAKIFPGGAREWDWRETGTRHVPGIQPADVQELIDRGAKAVVLSRGVWERLQVCPETLDALAKSGIEVAVLQNAAAVTRFNVLRESLPVGGLFHSTC
jgi:hypothetical protein